MKVKNLFLGALVALASVAWAADPPPPSFAGAISTQNLVPAGTCTANSCVELTVQGQGTVTVQTVGTYTGALSLQRTTDGTTWVTSTSSTTFTDSAGNQTATIASGTQDIFTATVAGAKRVRITGLAAMTGSVQVTIQSSPGGGGGGSGGGGGGAVTIANGADSSLGATTDAAATAGSTGTAQAKLRLMTSQLDQLHTDITTTNTQLVASMGILATASSSSIAFSTSDAGPVTAGTATATRGIVAVGTYNSTPPTVTNGQQVGAQMDANGYLKVNVAAGSSSGTVAQGSTTSGQSGMLVQGAVTTSPPSYTNAQTSPVSLDAAGNLRVLEADSASFTGTCAASCGSTTLGAVIDTTGYGSIEVQLTAAGTGTVTFQCSSDNTTFTSCAGQALSGAANATINQTTLTTVGQMVFPTWTRYFRLQVTSYTSGTFTHQTYLRRKSFSPFAQPVNVANTVVIAGQSNEGTTASASPVTISFDGRTSNKTAVTNNQVVRGIATTVGAQVVHPWSIPELEWNYAAASGGISNTTTAVTMVAAAGSGVRNYVTSCQVSSDALGAATELAIRDGAAGTVLWRLKVGTAGILSYHIGFGTPLKGTANTLLEVVTLTASVTGGIFINCQGFQAP